MRLLILLPVCLACAADWDRKPFTAWDQDTAFHLLTDSPWARRETARLTWTKPQDRPFSYKDVPGADGIKTNSGLGPLGGIGAGKPKFPLNASLIFRWSSALPVRHATAVFRQHDEKLPAAKLNALIPQPEPDAVFEIFGVPVEMAHQGASTLEYLATSAITLTTAGGRVLKPTSAKATILGETLSLQVHFPRDPALTLADREIECKGDLQVLSFKVKFRLGAMLYQGRLEL